MFKNTWRIRISREKKLCTSKDKIEILTGRSVIEKCAKVYFSQVFLSPIRRVCSIYNCDCINIKQKKWRAKIVGDSKIVVKSPKKTFSANYFLLRYEITKVKGGGSLAMVFLCAEGVGKVGEGVVMWSVSFP